MKNLLTDVPGLKVGNAEDARLASGATAVVFDAPAAAGFAVPGGSPALRDTGLLAPEMTVARVDAFVLSGGSVFGLDAPGGAIAWLHAQGRGLAVGAARAPIVPGAALFDLDNGGDKDWGRRSPYFDLGWAAAENAGLDFALGSVGAGCGATTCDLKGGLGSASAVSSKGFVVGALAAVNAVGQGDARVLAAFLGRGLRARRRIRRARRRRAVGRRARLRAEARRARQHHARRRRHRRAARQGAGDAAGDDGDGRLRAGASAGARALRRRRRLRRRDRRAPIARPTCATSPRSARSPPNASRALSPAASTKRRRCRLPARCRAGRGSGQ